MRYLSILLAVALLFSGVTFARYALSRNESVNTGIAKYDASYTIDGVNSLTFGNQSYWKETQGIWSEVGGSRTVRIGMHNNSDVDVRAHTLTMEGPAEFWENIALQLTCVKNDDSSETGFSAGEIVTTQYVLADFLRVRGEGDSQGSETHNFDYDDYINWDSNSGANGAVEGVFDTDFSDEFGQRGAVEETFEMKGGITADWGAEEPLSYDLSKVTDFSGSVTAVRRSACDTASENEPDAFGSGSDLQNLTITITASMKTVEYSVGFVRRDGNRSMPAFYLDCVKTVPYYTIEITLPENYKTSEQLDDPYFILDGKSVEDGTSASGEADSVLVFLTWTNSVSSSDLESDAAFSPDDFESIENSGGTFNGATVIGYHFNYNDVPTTTEGETTTVRMNKALKTWTVEEDGTITTTSVEADKQITWEHISTIRKGDGVYAHPLEEQTDGSYKCSGNNQVTIGADVLGASPYDGSFSSSDFEETNGLCIASEKGYAVKFGVYFEQSSELPLDTTP